MPSPSLLTSRSRPSADGLAGRVALVTGSSHGIGSTIAAGLAESGATVAVHGRDAAAASSVAEVLRERGARAVAVTGDVTSGADLTAIHDQVLESLGPVDVLVANAGGSHARPAPLEDIAEDDWQAAIDGNLLATFLTLRCFLPGMKRRRRGTIVTLGSSAGRRADPRAPCAYAVAKAGVVRLTQQVAAQVGPFGIRVNCLAPETIVTDAIRARIPAERQERMADAHPLRRLGTPDDVAAAAVFLAGERSSWITGAVLDITGGAVLV